MADRGRAELTARLGVNFLTRLHVMLGAEEKPLTPRRPLPDLSAAHRFAEPVVTQEVISKSLHALSVALSEILERRGQGLRLLEAVFFRADGKVERIAVRTGAPLRDPDVMLRLLNQRLDALADPLDPGFGFDLIRLEARIAEETHPTEASFDADENARRQIAFLADRLCARFGEHRVQRFVPQDTHIPEAQSVAVPAQDRDFDGSWIRRRRDADPPLRPLRMLEKPEEIHSVDGLGAGWSARAIPLAAGGFRRGPRRRARTHRHGMVAKAKADAGLLPGGDRRRSALLALSRRPLPRTGPGHALVSAGNICMSAAAYVELAVTTNFSFLRGASSPGQFVEQAALLGYPAIGIADRNSLAGVVRAYAEWKKLDPQARPRLLIGARLVFRDGTPGHSRLSPGPQSLCPALPPDIHRQAARPQGRVLSGFCAT